ncbi:MAG: flagellar export protein FliJ [Burkholderiaceae bacterium]|nr:flagellar export protein FliJ [Burkholderiaceae bacterium]
MKKRTLQQLIDNARRVRDDAAVRVAGAHREADGAQRTLDMLSSYRDEQMRNGAALSRIDPALLRLRGRFADKLGVAIDDQTRTRDALHVAVERQRDALIDRQRALLAFEALQARREAAAQQRRARLEQRDTDELAAQTARRGPWQSR